MDILKYKGIHPGKILERELDKRGLKQRPFALSMGEQPQKINAIIKGRRGVPVSLALKIEKELGFNEGDFALLQTYYDVKKEKNRLTVNIPDLRKELFWDTDFEKIDWDQQANAIIRRVFERGNKEEKQSIIRFYSNQKIEEVLSKNDVNSK